MSWYFQPIIQAAYSQAGKSGYIKVWTGSQWVGYPVKYWTGSQWIQKPLKYYTGATWNLAKGD